jgi:hypothetical protein
MHVTIGVLIYKSRRWLDFVERNLREVKNETTFDIRVIGCDACPELVSSGRLSVDYRNVDPNEYYLNRVYRCWNEAVFSASTEVVVLVNSDMAFSDDWLDSLVRCHQELPMSIPTSLLCESDRMPSAWPEYRLALGTTPESFLRNVWYAHANPLRIGEAGNRRPGRLYSPILFTKTGFMAAGGFPHGNPGGTPGDRYLVDSMNRMGYTHLTCMDSVVYHIQAGESEG